MKKNNHGFSLVELMIVIAMMSILVGAISIGFSIIRNNDIKKTNNFVKSALSDTKSYCLAKRSAECIFYKDGDDLKCQILVNGDVVSDEVIGGKKITIKYKVAASKGSYSVSDGDVKTVGGLGSGNELRIQFDHSSGALKPYNNGGASKQYVYQLYICKDSKVITYEFIPATGKFDMK